MEIHDDRCGRIRKHSLQLRGASQVNSAVGWRAGAAWIVRIAGAATPDGGGVLARPGARWLDLGCGRQLLPEWNGSADRQAAMAGQACLPVGAGSDPSLYEKATVPLPVFAPAAALPLRGESFDLVTADAAVESLEHPRTLCLRCGARWRRAALSCSPCRMPAIVWWSCWPGSCPVACGGGRCSGWRAAKRKTFSARFPQ